MKRNISLFISALLLLITIITNGQGCESLLMNGVFNTFNSISGNYSSSEWHNYWCNGMVEQVTQGSSSGAALNLGIAKISLGLSFSDAKEFQRIYQSINCGTNTGGVVNVSNNQVIQKTASPEILNAYVKCKEIESDGLRINLQLRPDDRKVFVIDARFTKNFGNPNGPLIKEISFVPNVISVKQGSLEKGIRMKTGETYSMVCERSTDVPLTILIDTEVGSYTANLPAFLPPPTEQEKIMAALPRGTILGWFEPSQIPRGWVICDGNSGTPNLINRFPLGTNDIKELGKQVGNENHDHRIQGRTQDLSNGEGVGGGEDAPSVQVMGPNRRKHTHGIDFRSQQSDWIPPSTKLIFIMKL